MKNLIVFILVLIFFPLKAQFLRKDTSKTNLLTKPYIERPLVNYKNQWTISIDYGYHIIYNLFNDKGEIRSLAKAGQHTYQDSWAFKICYGLFKNTEVGLSGSYINRIDYLNKVSYQFEKNEESFNIQETKRIKTQTWNNFDIYFKYMLPLKNMEVALSCGANLYIIPDNNEAPEIYSYSTIVNSVSDNNSFKEVIVHKNLTHNNKIFTGIESRFKFSKSDIYFSATYYKGLNKEIVYDWNTSLNTNSLTYEPVISKTRFSYGNLINYEAIYRYQVKPVFLAYIGIEGENYFGGTIETLLVPESESTPWHQFNGKLGYILQLSPNFHFEQSIFKCLKGRNADIPFTVHTSMFFNFF